MPQRSFKISKWVTIHDREVIDGNTDFREGTRPEQFLLKRYLLPRALQFQLQVTLHIASVRLWLQRRGISRLIRKPNSPHLW